MAVNQTGNQFLFPDKQHPENPLNLEVLERFLNTQVVNRVTGFNSSQPVLGLPGTGIVNLASGGIMAGVIQSQIEVTQDSNGPYVGGSFVAPNNSVPAAVAACSTKAMTLSASNGADTILEATGTIPVAGGSPQLYGAGFTSQLIDFTTNTSVELLNGTFNFPVAFDTTTLATSVPIVNIAYGGALSIRGLTGADCLSFVWWNNFASNPPGEALINYSNNEYSFIVGANFVVGAVNPGSVIFQNFGASDIMAMVEHEMFVFLYGTVSS